MYTQDLEQLSLTLDSQGYEYHIVPLSEASTRQSKNAFSISPPGMSPGQNILLGVSGMEADLSLQFYLHDNGEDKSNGTYSETVVTLAEQRRYLLDEIHAPDFAASWTLNHEGGDQFDNMDVFIERIDVPAIVQGSPKWLEARIDLRRGRSIG